MATAVQDSRPCSRAMRRFRCAAMVSGLARSWQRWASTHAEQQDAAPAGWVPDSVKGEGGREKRERGKPKLAVTPLAVDAAGEDGGGGGIRTGAVTRTVEPKRSDCGSGLVCAVKEKIDGGHLGSDEHGKPFLGAESPTRRRHCSSKASGGLKAWAQLEKEVHTMGSRSSSLDTEDSGLGEESDYRSDPNEEQENTQRRTSRPKIKVSNMGDLKARWAQWSQEHVEGQKLNPFSEEFDYELAMSQRLQKGDAGYGKPKEGSKTAERGERAQRHIRREMDEMCYIIRDMGSAGEDGRIRMTFGRLFQRYVKISDKVVGILLRCRKHGMVDFLGEMLWQGQDDDVIITLLD